MDSFRQSKQAFEAHHIAGLERPTRWVVFHIFLRVECFESLDKGCSYLWRWVSVTHRQRNLDSSYCFNVDLNMLQLMGGITGAVENCSGVLKVERFGLFNFKRNPPSLVCFVHYVQNLHQTCTKVVFTIRPHFCSCFSTKPVLHLTSPSRAGLVIPALQAYKRFCFVSLIIPVILQCASTNVQGQSSDWNNKSDCKDTRKTWEPMIVYVHTQEYCWGQHPGWACFDANYNMHWGASESKQQYPPKTMSVLSFWSVCMLWNGLMLPVAFPKTKLKTLTVMRSLTV